MEKTFQYRTTVKLQDPLKCEGCKFVIENDSYDRYCGARDEGEEDLLYAYATYWDGTKEVLGDGIDGKRPEWCPLEEVEDG